MQDCNIAASQSRLVRIFLSSTFRDFGEERDLLVRRVFPGLRARLKDRLVDLVDVDLRWGITVEEAERGEVLPICLAEIDRSRPFFVGLLGERYGWVPEEHRYAPDLLERQSWLNEHRGGKSVTELEILHGVLNDPAMAGRALFYFRSADYARTKGGEYLPSSVEDAERQRDLKERIRRSGFPVFEDYADPETLAAKLEEDLWSILDEMFPADEVPDAFDRESRRHDAYAAPRRRLYLGGDAYRLALDTALDRGEQRILIEGQSGGGKSALIANWIVDRRASHPQELVFAHYTGASADAAYPVSLVRRLCEAVRRETGTSEEIPGDPQKVLEGLPLWLATASAYAVKEGRNWLIAIDSLNGLTDLRDLRWFPEFLPERVSVVISCLPGEVFQALETKGAWERIVVAPLDRGQARTLLADYLRIYNKTLPAELIKTVIDHPLSTNPLFLRTLAEELRLFGIHEELSQRLDHYLESRTVDDLFEKVLARVEQDCEPASVQKIMEGIWASRAGLTEEEIRGYADLPPARWAPIRYALDEALLESGGRITFAHDYLRIAVSDRYLKGNGSLEAETQSGDAKKLRQQAHRSLAQWFETRDIDARSAEEIPWQWRQARDWEKLKNCLTSREMFEAIYAARTKEELLSYWLDLEREAEADIEADYERAWCDWAPDEESEETGDLAGRLSSFLWAAGRYTDLTVRLARLVHQITTQIYGEDSPQKIQTCNILADILSTRADYPEAERFYRQALAIAEKLYGSEHPETSNCLEKLATLLESMSLYADAESLYRRALAIREKALGTQHPDVAVTLNNLAALIGNRGLAGEDPEPFLRRALAIQTIVLGIEDTSTVLTMHNIAVTLKEKGNLAEAETLERQALAARKSILGSEHPHTALSLLALAKILLAAGKKLEGEDLLQRALIVFEKRLGVDHPQTVSCLIAMATELQEKKSLLGAETILVKILNTSENKLGNQSIVLAGVLNNLANILDESGSYEKAELFHRRALDIRIRALGEQDIETAKSLNNIGHLLHHIGRTSEAEEFYRRAVSITEKLGGSALPIEQQVRRNLADLLVENVDFEGAVDQYRNLLHISEKLYGPSHTKVATELDLLALLFCQQELYDEAEPIFYRASEIRRTALDVNHLDNAMSDSYFALLLFNTERYQEAEFFNRRALKIRENSLSLNHPDVIETRKNIERVLTVLGRVPDVELIYSRGDFILVTNYAKAIAHSRDAKSLDPAIFLSGAIVASLEKNIWAEELRRMFNPDLRQKITNLLSTQGFILNSIYEPTHEKMPISAVLKRIIAAHTHSSMKQLVDDLTTEILTGNP